MSALVSVPVGVVVERRKATSPWADFVWQPVAVLPDAPDAAPWTVLVPGAAMSGLIRLLPSAVTGPRLLKEAMESVPVVSAPTVNDGS